jgi:hypothetical protein
MQAFARKLVAAVLLLSVITVASAIDSAEATHDVDIVSNSRKMTGVSACCAATLDVMPATYMSAGNHPCMNPVCLATISPSVQLARCAWRTTHLTAHVY